MSLYFIEISGDVGMRTRSTGDVVAAITVLHACLSLCDDSAAGTNGELRKVTYRRWLHRRHSGNDVSTLSRVARNRGLISQRKGP